MTIEEQLRQEGYVLTLSVGVSMRPMLTQRTEQLLIEAIAESPSVNDVVLFRRSSGQYVLHRIIRKTSECYLIRGDNCYGGEKVLPEQIIGILKGFYRGERFIDCRVHKGYRLYVALWRLSYPLRYLFHHALRFLRKGISLLRR